MKALTNKEKYKKLCELEDSIPIFSRFWWLNAACGDSNWDVVLVEKGGIIFGSMPYMIKQKFMFTLLVQPQLTQVLGPWIRYPENQKYEKKLSHEKKIISSLVGKLPHFSMYRQSFHYKYQNWLPFYWLGFTQTTRYTYVIEDLSNTDDIWLNMQSRIKTDIRKATDKFGLQLVISSDLDDFLRVNAMTFSRQGIKALYSNEFVKKLDFACTDNDCRRIFLAKDSHGRIHAAIYIIWDEQSAYYLMGGGDPELRNSGATAFLIWEAIKFCGGVTKAFDFEGSMLESVENFCRGFGAVQKSYHTVSKINSKLLRFILKCKEAIGK